MAKKKNKEIFAYKGKPLVRRDRIIYYGDPKEKYIILFTINETKVVSGLNVASKVSISLQTNGGQGKERVIKKAEREGLWKALDIAEFWLTDAIENA